MAHVLQLNYPQAKLTSIINVSQRVGPISRATNLQNDVDAVEKLLLIIDSSASDGVNINNNGTFDLVTGFYIFNIQWKLKHKFGKQSIVVDGVVSPAKSFGYGGDSIYTIVQLNAMAKTQNPAGYEQFRNSFRCIG